MKLKTCCALAAVSLPGMLSGGGATAPQSPVAASHVRKAHPQLVREYGKFLWLDPGAREVREYSLRSVMDGVKRCDVDGVHFDDCFHPCKESVGGRELGFPWSLRK